MPKGKSAILFEAERLAALDFQRRTQRTGDALEELLKCLYRIRGAEPVRGYLGAYARLRAAVP